MHTVWVTDVFSFQPVPKVGRMSAVGVLKHGTKKSIPTFLACMVFHTNVVNTGENLEGKSNLSRREGKRSIFSIILERKINFRLIGQIILPTTYSVLEQKRKMAL